MLFVVVIFDVDIVVVAFVVVIVGNIDVVIIIVVPML